MRSRISMALILLLLMSGTSTKVYGGTPVDELKIQNEQALTAQEAEQLAQQMWEQWKAEIADQRRDEIAQGEVTVNDVTMKFHYQIFGEPREDGTRSLYISMHGGGNTTQEANDQQWENQKRLYQPKEGIYLAPRAPRNTWNMWHEEHIDPLFDYIIESLVVLENVDPNRVYLMGYSAGGDGVYQLAPRMADRFAAAAMAAGHPNETEPYGLRNLPFTLHMGGQDAAYDRNKVAARWRDWLAELKTEDPEGYEHWVVIYPTYGHWMNRADATAVPWMAKFERNAYPDRVVWLQDDVTHTRFYWLAVDPELQQERAMVIANIKGQEITIERSDVARLKIRLHDKLLNLDEPIRVVMDGKVLFEGMVPRTKEAIAQAFSERKDPKLVYYAEIEVEI